MGDVVDFEPAGKCPVSQLDSGSWQLTYTGAITLRCGECAGLKVTQAVCVRAGGRVDVAVDCMECDRVIQARLKGWSG